MHVLSSLVQIFTEGLFRVFSLKGVGISCVNATGDGHMLLAGKGLMRVRRVILTQISCQGISGSNSVAQVMAAFSAKERMAEIVP